MTDRIRSNEITRTCDAPKCKSTEKVIVTPAETFRQASMRLDRMTARWVTTGSDHYCPQHQ
jgi:hypothetical protein